MLIIQDSSWMIWFDLQTHWWRQYTAGFFLDGAMEVIFSSGSRQTDVESCQIAAIFFDRSVPPGWRASSRRVANTISPFVCLWVELHSRCSSVGCIYFRRARVFHAFQVVDSIAAKGFFISSEDIGFGISKVRVFDGF